MSDHPTRSHRSREYLRYIASPAWAELRARYFRYRLIVCAGCKGTGRLDLHHRTYARFGAERISDMVALCRDCHDRVHRLVRSGLLLQLATDQVAPRRVRQKRWRSGVPVGLKAYLQRSQPVGPRPKRRSAGERTRLVAEARARLAVGLDLP